MPTALTYHDVVSPDALDSSGFPGALAARYKLSPEHFQRHLDAFEDLGIPVGTDLLEAQDRTLLLTFDDGGSSALYIADQLEARGWRGCFFIVTSLIGSAGFLDHAQIRDLHGRGHLIGSHSHGHPTYMGKLGSQELINEWSRSRDLLGEALGTAPTYASIPGGFASDAVLESARECQYEVLFTSDPDSRRRKIGTLTVSGRFSIWSTTPAKSAAAYAAQSGWARRRLQLEWRLKQAAKRTSPGLYERLRKIRAGQPGDR